MVDDMARSFSGADRVIVSGVYGAREDGSSKRTKKGDGRGSLDRDAPTVDIDGAYLAASIKGFEHLFNVCVYGSRRADY